MKRFIRFIIAMTPSIWLCARDEAIHWHLFPFNDMNEYTIAFNELDKARVIYLRKINKYRVDLMKKITKPQT